MTFMSLSGVPAADCRGRGVRLPRMVWRDGASFGMRIAAGAVPQKSVRSCLPLSSFHVECGTRRSAVYKSSVLLFSHKGRLNQKRIRTA